MLAVLEAVRGKVMQRIGTWVEHRVAPEGFVRALESTLRGRPYRMEALRDLAVCRGYLGSPGALSLYDVPWVPIYIAVIFLLHPVMGCIALGGAVLLFGLTLASELSTSALLKQANTAAMSSQRRADAHLPQCRGDRQHGHAALGDRPLARIGRGHDRAAAARRRPRRAAGRRHQVLPPRRCRSPSSGSAPIWCCSRS